MIDPIEPVYKDASCNDNTCMSWWEGRTNGRDSFLMGVLFDQPDSAWTAWTY